MTVLFCWRLTFFFTVSHVALYLLRVVPFQDKRRKDPVVVVSSVDIRLVKLIELVHLELYFSLIDDLLGLQDLLVGEYSFSV
mgnify:CR=1 FL=1